MTYQVLARKWRPAVFDAVVGQEPITRTLQNALLSGRVAHAYLFTGPRGVGKTTTARLLAKALCCPERKGAEACGACPSCLDFVSGAPVDVMEIDAASNTSIDDIRTLRENVKYAPARGRFKVYIVDEVHMLSGAAFNAFLKTLEEPPAHVVFVLATTEPKRIPATVLSRCQRFDFKPIPPEMLTASLTEILTKEQVPFEPAALPMLVRAAEGSLRDALSLLDTAIAYGEGRLDEDGVARLLGSGSRPGLRHGARRPRRSRRARGDRSRGAGRRRSPAALPRGGRDRAPHARAQGESVRSLRRSRPERGRVAQDSRRRRDSRRADLSAPLLPRRRHRDATFAASAGGTGSRRGASHAAAGAQGARYAAGEGGGRSREAPQLARLFGRGKRRRTSGRGAGESPHAFEGTRTREGARADPGAQFSLRGDASAGTCRNSACINRRSCRRQRQPRRGMAARRRGSHGQEGLARLGAPACDADRDRRWRADHCGRGQPLPQRTAE